MTKNGRWSGSMPSAPKVVSASRSPAVGMVGFRALCSCTMVSGFLLWLSFVGGTWLSWLAPLALVPLHVLVWIPARLSHTYVAAFVGGLVFFGLGLFWVGMAAPYWWQALLMRAALSGYCALYFPSHIFLSRILTQFGSLPAILAIPVSWTALEYLRTNFISGFGWLLLGHSWYGWTWTIQIADLGGVFAVSFWIAWASALLLELMLHPLMKAGQFDPTGALRWRLLVTASLAILVWGYGWYRVREFDRVTQPGPTVLLQHVALPQSVVSDKWEEDSKIINAQSHKLRQLPADLFVVPETSLLLDFFGEADSNVPDLEIARLYIERDVPGGPNDDYPLSAKLGAHIRETLAENRRRLLILADDHDKPVLVSVFRRVFSSGRYAKYNAAVLGAPKIGVVAHYDKIHLVPFGEYLPFKDSFPLLRVLVPYDPSATFGLDHAERLQAIHFGKLHFGTMICFEDTVPWIARGFASMPNKPIDFLVNQSNDGWFPHSMEAHYHAVAGLFRCVENRLAMVRATNFGVTCLIDSCGRIRDRHPIGEPGGLTVSVPVDRRQSLYTRWGDWLPISCWLVIGFGGFRFLVTAWQRTRRRLETKVSSGSWPTE